MRIRFWKNDREVMQETQLRQLQESFNSQFRELQARLDRIERMLLTVLRGERTMSQQVEDIKNDVRANTDVVKSATILINGFNARLEAAIAAALAAGASAAELQELRVLADDMKANDADLAAAVAANTPAQP